MASQASATQIAEATRLNLAALIRLKGGVAKLRRPPGRRVANAVSGGASTKLLGRGLDFSEVREYYAGDDVRLIDWNVTARSGKPHTKVFNEERERPFLLMLDLSRSMHFATRVAYKSVVASRLAATLAWAAAASGDAVGGLVLTEDRMVEVTARGGSRGATSLLGTLVTEHNRIGDSQATVTDAGNSISDAIERLVRRRWRGASICLLSDFHRGSPQRAGALQQLLSQNHVAAVRVYDPIESQLPPPARYRVSDGVRHSSFDSTSDDTRDNYQRAYESSSVALENVFSGSGSSYHQCSVTDPLLPLARQIMRRLPGSLG